MLKKMNATVWVPSFTCDNDFEMNVSMQDLADCAMLNKESALQFIEDLKETYKKEWSNFSDVSPCNVFEDVTEETATWFGWEFTWTSNEKDYLCAMYIQEVPIMVM